MTTDAVTRSRTAAATAAATKTRTASAPAVAAAKPSPTSASATATTFDAASTSAIGASSNYARAAALVVRDRDDSAPTAATAPPSDAASLDKALTTDQKSKLATDQKALDDKLAKIAADNPLIAHPASDSQASHNDEVRARIAAARKPLLDAYFADPAHRYATLADGHIASVDYQPATGIITMSRTGDTVQVEGTTGDVGLDRNIHVTASGDTSSDVVLHEQLTGGERTTTESVLTRADGSPDGRKVSAVEHMKTANGSIVDNTHVEEYDENNKLTRITDGGKVTNGADSANEVTVSRFGADGKLAERETTSDVVNDGVTTHKVADVYFQDGKKLREVTDIKSDATYRGGVCLANGENDPGRPESHVTAHDEMQYDPATGKPVSGSSNTHQNIGAHGDDPAIDTTESTDKKFVGGELSYQQTTTDRRSVKDTGNNNSETFAEKTVETLDGKGAALTDDSRASVHVDRAITSEEQVEHSVSTAPMHHKTTTRTTSGNGAGATLGEIRTAAMAGLTPPDPQVSWNGMDVHVHHVGDDDDTADETYHYNTDQLDVSGFPKADANPEQTSGTTNVDGWESFRGWFGEHGSQIALGLAIVALPFTGGASAALIGASMAVGAADTINNVARAASGDQGASWLGAGMSALGMLPGLGAGIRAGSSAAVEGIGLLGAIRAGAKTFLAGGGETALGAGIGEFRTALAAEDGFASAVGAGARAGAAVATASTASKIMAGIGAANVTVGSVGVATALADGDISGDDVMMVTALLGGFAKGAVRPALTGTAAEKAGAAAIASVPDPAKLSFDGPATEREHAVKHGPEYQGEFAIDGVSVTDSASYVARAQDLVAKAKAGDEHLSVRMGSGAQSDRMYVLNHETGEVVILKRGDAAGADGGWKLASMFRVGVGSKASSTGDLQVPDYVPSDVRESLRDEWIAAGADEHAQQAVIDKYSLSLDASRTSGLADIDKLDAARAKQQAIIDHPENVPEAVRERVVSKAKADVAGYQTRIDELKLKFHAGDDAAWAAERASLEFNEIAVNIPEYVNSGTRYNLYVRERIKAGSSYGK